jgi:hypothetical protein
MTSVQFEMSGALPGDVPTCTTDVNDLMAGIQCNPLFHIMCPQLYPGSPVPLGFIATPLGKNPLTCAECDSGSTSSGNKSGNTRRSRDWLPLQ